MANRFHSPFSPNEVIRLVPSADGKKWIEPTLVQAKKLCLKIGVTSTLDVDKDSLVDWKLKQAIFRCAVLPYRGGVDEHHKLDEKDYAEYEGEILGQMSDELNIYSEDGSAVDLAVKNYFEGKPYTNQDAVMAIVEVMQTRMKELGVVKVRSDLRINSDALWVTGEPDFFGFNSTGHLIWLTDLKRKNNGVYKKCNTEGALEPTHKLQLGGYSLMLKEQFPHDNIQLDQLLSNRDDNGQAKIIPYKDTATWEQAYFHHNKSFFLRKGWNPQADFEARKEEIKKQIDDILEHQKWAIN